MSLTPAVGRGWQLLTPRGSGPCACSTGSCSQAGRGAGQPLEPGVKILAGEWMQWKNQMKESFTKEEEREEYSKGSG